MRKLFCPHPKGSSSHHFFCPQKKPRKIVIYDSVDLLSFQKIDTAYYIYTIKVSQMKITVPNPIFLINSGLENITLHQAILLEDKT